ncbi:MAG: Calcium-gated potassium channel MthK [Methanoregula sp. PtaU1.Bin051]|nr:MAG: Calcium-gated potassium channel MthK [Methanoregula sp. PtaU1.Bin051]
MPLERKRRGTVWRTLRTSPSAQISLYFLAFAMLIGLYTYIFHSLYPILENKPIQWSEALLFVVESMATVGYGWLLPFHNDLTRLLTIQIMLSGVIMIFIVVPLLLAPFLTTLLAPTPPRRTPHALKGHIVVIGYDEITRSLIESLMISDHEIVIIEEDKASALEIGARFRHRAYVIWGDYMDTATWASAHVDDAEYIVICKDERLTANIVLGIRQLTGGKIISVVDKLSFDRYLRYAGADYVLSPKHATGRILANHAVLNPAADAMPDIPGLDRLYISAADHQQRELRLINIPIVTGCMAAGKTLMELSLMGRYGILVPFIWKAGTFIPDPSESEIVDGSTSLFLFGTADAVANAIKIEFDPDGCMESRAVIAGFGDVGASAYSEMQSAGISCTVVDSKKHEIHDQVVGNAEDESILKDARIDLAQYCIVALNNDDVNIFTTLMARNMNPSIRILARANEPKTVDKLYRAGADYVALLPTIGGQIIGRIVLSDIVTILLDLPDGNIVVMKHITTKNVRTTVGHIKRVSGARILGIEAANRTIVAPEPDELLKEGDAVVAVGDAMQLKRFIHAI